LREGEKYKTGRESYFGCRDRLLKLLLRLALDHLLFTPAKAFPIAFWTPDATGAMTAAVIPGVVHDFDYLREL